MSCTTRTISIASRDGVRLYAQWHQPSGWRATLVLCHGIGEHSGRYGRFIDQLLEAGIATLRYDQRGHGESGGRRGHVDHFSDYLDDLQCVLQSLEQNARARPLYVFGHSMGGVVVTQFLLKASPPQSIRGAVLSSPGFVPAVRVPTYKRVLSKLLLPIAPQLRFPTGIGVRQLCRDPVQQHKFETDPKTFGRVSVRWYAEFQRAAADCLEQAQHISLPLYVCVGAADGVVSPEGARRFVELVSSGDKTLRTWDGLLHEPLNESAGERVGHEIIEWILAHAPDSG